MGRQMSYPRCAEEVHMEATVLQQHWDPRERVLLAAVDKRITTVIALLLPLGLTREVAHLALASDEVHELIRGNLTEDTGHDSLVEMSAALVSAAPGRQMAGVA